MSPAPMCWEQSVSLLSDGAGCVGICEVLAVCAVRRPSVAFVAFMPPLVHLFTGVEQSHGRPIRDPNG